MRKFQKRLEELLKDKSVIDELRHFYHKGEITAEMLGHMLSTNKITLSEYIGIVHESDEEKKS